MKRNEFYQEVLTKLKSSKSIENFHFEAMGIECHISRNIYPTSEFSAGIKGHSTSIHHIDSINKGCLGGFPTFTYEGNLPTLEVIASAITNCARFNFS